MQLPDWVEQPVPEYDVTPIHDAIGKFVVAFKRVEVWLAHLHTQLGGEPTYVEADRRGVSALLTDLSGKADLAGVYGGYLAGYGGSTTTTLFLCRAGLSQPNHRPDFPQVRDRWSAAQA